MQSVFHCSWSVYYLGWYDFEVTTTTRARWCWVLNVQPAPKCLIFTMHFNSTRCFKVTLLSVTLCGFICFQPWTYLFVLLLKGHSKRCFLFSIRCFLRRTQTRPPIWRYSIFLTTAVTFATGFHLLPFPFSIEFNTAIRPTYESITNSSLPTLTHPRIGALSFFIDTAMVFLHNFCGSSSSFVYLLLLLHKLEAFDAKCLYESVAPLNSILRSYREPRNTSKSFFCLITLWVSSLMPRSCYRHECALILFIQVFCGLWDVCSLL